MNNLENQMLDILKNLEENHGVIGVKAEFEAEGSRFREVIRLKDIANKAGLRLYIKIGGCEAVTNLLDCEDIGVDGVIAPMIESPFALEKYAKMVEKFVPDDLMKRTEYGITFETKTAHKQIDSIINSPYFDFLSAFTIGRVDLSSSYGLTRKEINSKEMLNYCEDIFGKLVKKDIIRCLGGEISSDAIDFIKYFEKFNLNRIETRKIVFSIPKALKNLTEGLKLGAKFEYLWLSNKKEHYEAISREDDLRLKMLKERL